MDSFTGKLAVVTGGGSGMGRELVRQLAAQGCSVAACDLNADAVAVTAATAWAAAPPGAQVTSHACDVSDEAQVQRFRDELLAMHDAHDGFELAFSITREAARRPADFSRRLDMPIIAELLQRLPANPGIAFICGSNPFVEGAAQGLIDAGLPAPLIRTERYGV